MGVAGVNEAVVDIKQGDQDIAAPGRGEGAAKPEEPKLGASTHCTFGTYLVASNFGWSGEVTDGIDIAR